VILLEGSKVGNAILKELKGRTAFFTSPPGLAFILVGSHPASQIYVQIKKQKAREVGVVSQDYYFSENVSQEELLLCIEQLNRDPRVHGILLQQPLPGHLSLRSLLEAITPAKDVDGFHPLNMGRLLMGDEGGFIPCTPLGIHQLLISYEIPLKGKHVVIVGRSNIVGKPLAALLVQKKDSANATVTLAHTATSDLQEITRSADILIVAIGKTRFIGPSMVKKGTVVVDVGIHRQGSHIVGDVDFEQVAPLASHITPVPGGVGPMTVTMLLSNTLLSFERSGH